MNLLHIRFFSILLCFALPLGWCWGQVLHSSQDPSHPVHWGEGEGLHSSTNPTGWVSAMPVSTEDSPQEKGATLKEPVIPNENLDVKQVSEDSENGTLYETGMATYYSAKNPQLKINMLSSREVIVDVRDRGPFAKGRVIDLSNKAAEILGMLSDGVVPVELWVIDD